MQVQEIRQFHGGEDLSSSDSLVPRDRPRKVSGMSCTRRGRLTVTPGPSAIFSPAGGGLVSLTRYVGSAIKRLIWSTGTNVYSQDESVALAPTDLGITAGATRFAQMENALVWTDSGGYPRVWRGAGVSVEAGMPTPSSGPTSVDDGAGVLNSAGKAIPFYQWVYTFADDDGVESAPSLPSIALGLTNRDALVKVIRASALDIPARCTKINWYRRGGSVSDYYKVGESAILVDSGIYPNTGSQLTDNTRDIDVSTVLVPRFNARPPQYATILQVHNSRMWYGFENSLKLYFSATNNPEIVASDTSPLASDGGFLTLPGGFDDYPLALSSTGSLLIVARRRSIYALFGNNFNNFAFSQRANVGIVNRESIVRAVNHVYFVGTDRRVYQLLDDDLQWISKDIQLALDSLTQAQFDTAVLAYCDNRLVLSFGSSAPDTTYVFAIALSADDVAYGWTEEPGMRSRFMVGLGHPTSNYNEFVFVTDTGASVSRAFADVISQKAFIYRSGEFVYNQSESPSGGQTDLTAYALRIEGMFTAAVAPIVKAFVGYPTDGVTSSESYSLELGTRSAYTGRLPAGMCGAYAGVEVSGSAVPGSVLTLAAYTLMPLRSSL